MAIRTLATAAAAVQVAVAGHDKDSFIADQKITTDALWEIMTDYDQRQTSSMFPALRTEAFLLTWWMQRACHWSDNLLGYYIEPPLASEQAKGDLGKGWAEARKNLICNVDVSATEIWKTVVKPLNDKGSLRTLTEAGALRKWVDLSAYANNGNARVQEVFDALRDNGEPLLKLTGSTKKSIENYHRRQQYILLQAITRLSPSKWAADIAPQIKKHSQSPVVWVGPQFLKLTPAGNDAFPGQHEIMRPKAEPAPWIREAFDFMIKIEDQWGKSSKPNGTWSLVCVPVVSDGVGLKVPCHRFKAAIEKVLNDLPTQVHEFRVGESQNFTMTLNNVVEYAQQQYKQKTAEAVAKALGRAQKDGKQKAVEAGSEHTKADVNLANYVITFPMSAFRGAGGNRIRNWLSNPSESKTSKSKTFIDLSNSEPSFP